MNSFKTVVPFAEPSDILELLDGGGGQITEMNDSELGFLCGLIRDFRPKKIVEVGVAEGGTSAVILNCIHKLSLDCAVYSVDLSERLYYDPSKETGWQLKQAALAKPAEIDLTKHTLLLGDVLPAQLGKIGGGIDFLILDTAHTMPGEILDFIAAFPYLTENAVVVLHDILLGYTHNNFEGSSSMIATTVLFSSVAADKFLNNQAYYPNIGAFQLNRDTANYMGNLFVALMTRWSYLPEEKHLWEYEESFRINYPGEYLRIYEQAVGMARQALTNQIVCSRDQVVGWDHRSGARKLADKVLPKGSRRREAAKLILPKNSLRWRFCKKIYIKMRGL